MNESDWHQLIQVCFKRHVPPEVAIRSRAHADITNRAKIAGDLFITHEVKPATVQQMMGIGERTFWRLIAMVRSNKNGTISDSSSTLGEGSENGS